MMVTSVQKTLPAWDQAAVRGRDPGQHRCGSHLSSSATRGTPRRAPTPATRDARDPLRRQPHRARRPGRQPLKFTLVLSGTGADGNAVGRDLLAAGLRV